MSTDFNAIWASSKHALHRVDGGGTATARPSTVLSHLLYLPFDSGSSRCALLVFLLPLCLYHTVFSGCNRAYPSSYSPRIGFIPVASRQSSFHALAEHLLLLQQLCKFHLPLGHVSLAQKSAPVRACTVLVFRESPSLSEFSMPVDNFKPPRAESLRSIGLSLFVQWNFGNASGNARATTTIIYYGSPPVFLTHLWLGAHSTSERFILEIEPFQSEE